MAAAAIKRNKQEAILGGKIFPTLVSFAIPVICGNLFQQLYNIVDALVVGRFLGDLPLSGISAAAPVMDLIYGLFVGSCTGVGVLVGQLCGAGEWDRLKKVHATALIGGGIFALSFTLITLIFIRPFLVSEGFADDTVDQAVSYMTVIAAGLIFNFLYNYYAALLRSYGNSRLPFLVLAVSSTLHALLDLLLIAVLNLGIYGVACSTVFCQILSVIWLAGYTHKNCPELSLSRGELKVDRSCAGTILGYAWATAMQSTVVYTGRLLVQGTLTSLGTATVSGYNMGMRLEGLNQAISSGVSAGCVVCMAQNYGHGNAERVRRFFYRAYCLNICYGIVLGFINTFFAPQLIGIFTKSAEIIAAGAAYTGTMAFIYIFSCSGEMLQGFFRGIGKLKVCMIASAAQVCLRVILSYILVPKLGIYGICISVGTGWFLLTVFEGIFALKNSKHIVIKKV